MDGRTWARLIREEPYRIGHAVGFKDLTKLHNKWIQRLVFGSADDTLQAHRGSFKTSCLALALAIKTVIFPDRRMMLFRKTDTDVAEVLRKVAHILATDVFKSMSVSLWSAPVEITRLTHSEIDTNLAKGIKGTSQIVGLGLGSSVTGKHADDIHTDDIVNIKDRVSKAERDRTRLMYMELQNIKNRGGRIINCGTPWHKDDCFALMPNPIKYDCYTTGLLSDQEIINLRTVMTPPLFAANYELKHIASDDQLFDSPNFTDSKESLHEGIGHIDAAYGGTDATAFTGVKKTGNKITAFGKRWRKHVDDCIDEILLISEEYKLGTIYCESNSDKGYLEKALKRRWPSVKSYHEKTNKFIKISSHLRAEWKNIEFLKNTDPEYLAEILDYTEHAEHDDCPDSLASAVRLTTRQTRVQIFDGGI